jgi:hypothetical protein
LAWVDSSIVVSRWLAADAGDLEQVVARADELFQRPLPLGNAGRLVVRRRFAPVPSAPVSVWATKGWLHATGPHFAKAVRVELELAEHSGTAYAIDVRPVSPNVRRWGKWRYERYFDLAHRAADALTGGLRSARGESGLARS